MTRITKKEARKMYETGIGVTFCPSKCSPQSMLAVRMFKKDSDNGFDNLVNHFWYYQCNNATGNTVYFYA